MQRLRDLVFVAAASCAALASSAANAATVTVNVLTDTAAASCPATCSLRAALASAQVNDLVQFGVTGTITLSPALGPLVIARNLTLSGPGPSPFGIVVDGGGAIRILEVNDTAVTATVSRIAFRRGNGAGGTGNGGAIANRGTLTLAQVDVRESNATTGGGIYNETGALTVSESTVTLNIAASGGGIASTSGTLTVDNSVVSRNLATSASAVGGGGLFTQGNAAITNTSVALNNATTAAGGIAAFGTLNLTHCTVTANAAPSAAGISTIVSAAVRLQATIVAGNVGGSGCASPGSPIFASLGDNVSGDATCVNTSASLNDRNNTDPLFDGGLLNNGGPTETVALQLASPAVNAVTFNPCPPPARDQRGVTRPVGVRCDIGAFERDPAPVELIGFTVS